MQDIYNKFHVVFMHNWNSCNILIIRFDVSDFFHDQKIIQFFFHNSAEGSFLRHLVHFLRLKIDWVVSFFPKDTKKAHFFNLKKIIQKNSNYGNFFLLIYSIYKSEYSSQFLLINNHPN